MKSSMRAVCPQQVAPKRWYPKPSALAMGILSMGILLAGTVAVAPAVEPINIGFLWHMHQPTYYPGETVTQTDQFGQAASALAPTTAVPEPGTWWLAILGLLSTRHGRRVGTR